MKNMHLTNYSINKNNVNFKANKSLDDTDGFKWSLAALRTRLLQMNIEDKPIFDRIEEIVIKTIISAEPLLNNGVEMFVPYRNNCFELLGFDILIDDTLKPWLLEVNLSPSLNCDSPLDHSIKSNLIADLFTLAGIFVENS